MKKKDVRDIVEKIKYDDGNNISEQQSRQQIYSNVLVEENLDLFKFDKNNRDIDENHALFLCEEIKVCNMLPGHPIIVNKNKVVIDGQHRLIAAKILGLKIYYVVMDDIEISDINSHQRPGKPWTVDELIKFHCDKNSKDYELLKDYLDKYGSALEKCFAIELLSKVNNWTKAHQLFKIGKFEIYKYDQACQIGEMLLDIPKIIKFRKRKILTRTLSEVMLCENYDHKRMIDKMTKYPHLLVKCVDLETTLQNLEKVYNFNTGQKFHFMTDFEPETKRKIVKIIPYGNNKE